MDIQARGVNVSLPENLTADFFESLAVLVSVPGQPKSPPPKSPKAGGEGQEMILLIDFFLKCTKNREMKTLVEKQSFSKK